jgi:hypothetical protein
MTDALNDAARELLESDAVATVATLEPDGAPQDQRGVGRDGIIAVSVPLAESARHAPRLSPILAPGEGAGL